MKVLMYCKDVDLVESLRKVKVRNVRRFVYFFSLDGNFRKTYLLPIFSKAVL